MPAAAAAACTVALCLHANRSCPGCLCTPQRIARPWDTSDVDLTFQPRISANSQRIMSEMHGSSGSSGGGSGGLEGSSFLSRLDHDSRRREAKHKVIVRGDAGARDLGAPQALTPVAARRLQCT